MEKQIICSTCKRRLTNDSAVKFMCPKCGKQEIIRCSHCKSIAAKYKCHECNFEGPN